MKYLSALLVLGQAGLAAPSLSCSGSAYTDFDFWEGYWEVRTPDGQLAGTNHIQKQQGGCLLVEQWLGSGGGTGHSINYYHPSQDEWHQLWVSPNTLIDYRGGLDGDGAMRLEGSITYRKDGRTAPFRGCWRLQSDGSVRQILEEQDPNSGQWNNWFTGIYTRLSPGES